MKKPQKTKWSRPDEVMEQWISKQIAILVAAYHEHLEDAEISVLFCEDMPPRNGRRVLGTAHVMSEKERLLTGVDLLISLDQRWWKAAGEKQRKALLDHELCHFGLRADEDGIPERDDQGRTLYKMNAHDIEEFNAVIRRHGFWMHDVAMAGSAMLDSPDGEQLSLRLDEAADE